MGKATLDVLIDIDSENALSKHELVYVFKTLCIFLGTPWKLCFRDDVSQRPQENWDIYYGRQEGIKSRVHILPQAKIFKEPTRVVYKENTAFIFFDSVACQNNYAPWIIEGDRWTFYNDVIFSVFFMLSGKHECFIRKGKHDFHDLQGSFFHKHDLLHQPFINHYISLLSKIFQTSHDFLPRWPDGKKYVACLSHDVDYPEMMRWIEVFRYISKYHYRASLSAVKKIISGAESFWLFDDWMNLAESFGVRSSFYFSGLKSSLPRFFLKAPDPFYDVSTSKFTSLFKDMISRGFEVGMHASYLSHQSSQSFKLEKSKIEEAAGLSLNGNRHHFWHWNHDDPAETSLIHHQAGLTYDSSGVYEKSSGFRYGVALPFHFYHENCDPWVPTLELVPCLMDNHLFGHHAHSSFVEPQSEINALIKHVKESQGMMIVDYHVRVLNQTFFPGWKKTAEHFLEQICNDSEVYIAPLSEISDHWHERERKLIERSQDAYHPSISGAGSGIISEFQRI